MFAAPAFHFKDRVFHIAPWTWTLTCGLAKLGIALVALLLPFVEARSLGATVGWMLVAGAATELLLAWRGRSSWVGRLTFGSGAVTLLAGAAIVKSGWADLFPLAQLITVWLLLRGIMSLDIAIQSRRTPMANWGWVMARGAADLSLGVLLLMGAPLAMFTVVIFGQTQTLVTSFYHILAVSFLVAGMGLVSIAVTQRQHHLTDPFVAS